MAGDVVSHGPWLSIVGPTLQPQGTLCGNSLGSSRSNGVTARLGGRSAKDVQCLKHLELCSWKLDSIAASRGLGGDDHENCTC